MNSALKDTLAAISGALPARAAQLAADTATSGHLMPGQIGLVLRSEPDGLLALFLAGDARTSRDLFGQVRSFIGPSYAQRRRTDAYLTSATPFSDAVGALADLTDVSALVVPSAARDGFLGALERMLAVRERQPDVAVSAPRPLARILRDFEDAIARGDLAASHRLEAEAVATGRLSLVNRSLLQSRTLASAEDWSATVDHALRHRLPDLRLPAPVAHDLIRAAWHTWLVKPFGLGPDAARAAYRERVAPTFSPVFTDHRTAASVEARLAWLVHYSTLDPVPLGAMCEVLDSAPLSERPGLERLMPAEGGAPAPGPEIAALQHGGEHAAAYTLALRSKELPAAVRVDALRRTATHLEDPVRRDEAEQVARETGDQRDTPSTGFADVKDWGSWLAALFDHPDVSDASKVRRAGADRWTEAVADADDLSDWAESIEVLAGEAAFREAVPQLVLAVLPKGPEAEAVARRRARVLQGLAYAVASEPAPGSADLDAIADVAGALLIAGVDNDGYAKLVGQMVDLFERLGAPARLARWVVDVTRILLSSPAPPEAVRDEALRRIVAPLLPDAARSRPLVPAEVWAELAEVLEGCSGLDELLATLRRAAEPGDEDTDVFGGLQGRSVLLYTLVASAGDRARAYIEQRVSATVWADNSKVASKQLRDYASRASIVVVASRAAKHAAYDAIKAEAAQRLHYATGKGWSSLITAVREALLDGA